MRLRALLALDPFLAAMAICVAAASLVPVHGAGAAILGWITTAAITLLFFLHGARLSRAAVLEGAGHWRLHLMVAASTYALFPAIALALGYALRGLMDPLMIAGLLFLGILPSTVQSSIAFTSIARGNVAAAVCAAALSNLAGVVLTPLFAGVLLGDLVQRHAADGSGLGAVGAIALQLLLPFALGHLSRPVTAAFLARHRAWITRVDRGSILLVVYTAFSAAVVDGLWRRLSAGDIAAVLLLDAAVLALVLWVTTQAARRCGFAVEDEIALVFCGSKKSLASGVPMAGVLFAPTVGGAIIVPLMLFHQMQLTVCAILARRYAARPALAPSTPLSDEERPVR